MDPEQIEPTETDDSVSEASVTTDQTGESWENVGMASGDEDEEDAGAGGDAAAALPDPADDALPPMVAGTFTPPPSSVAASPTLSQRNSEIQVNAAQSEHKEILGLCRTQNFLQYVLLAILSVLLLRGAVQPNVTNELATTAQCLYMLKERTNAWQGNYSRLYSMWQDCSEKQEETMRWLSERQECDAKVVDLQEEVPRLRQVARKAKQCARHQVHLEEEIEVLRSRELLASQDKARLQELLDNMQEMIMREDERCKEKSKKMISAVQDDAEQMVAELRQEIAQLTEEKAEMREREEEHIHRYEQLNEALREEERLRREENAEWKQKHDELRLSLSEGSTQRLREEVESWKKSSQKAAETAERLKQRLHREEEMRNSQQPSWLNQVEEFRQRMTEEWQRHAKTHGNPYFGEWLEHARRQTEEVAEKLRKKYEKTRHQGQKAACRFSRRWGFKHCRDD